MNKLLAAILSPFILLGYLAVLVFFIACVVVFCILVLVFWWAFLLIALCYGIYKYLTE